MGSKTGIAWTDRTFNPWWGCTKISPACDHCYAATVASNRKHEVWGAGTPRRRTSEENRRTPFAWNREAARLGRKLRVLTLSMGDVMDGEVPQEWRAELYSIIDQTPNLDWQLLTKRPENYRRFLPKSFMHDNVWFGTTAENQQYYDLRWPTLAKLRERFPAAPLWISYEPALGPIMLKKGSHAFGVPGTWRKFLHEADGVDHAGESQGAYPGTPVDSRIPGDTADPGLAEKRRV
jgi:protein gp37